MSEKGSLLRRWLAGPAHGFAGIYLVVVPLLLGGTLGLAAGTWYLVSGDVRGGRVTALAFVIWSVAVVSVGVLGVRPSGRIHHLVLGVLLQLPINWLDTLVKGDDPHRRVPALTVLLALGLAWNLARFARRAGRSVADEPQAPVPTV